MSLVSYAQNREDVMLWRALKHVDSGFYVDVGACDPTANSVTKLFYDHGWRGINIEPVSTWMEQLQTHRPADINLQVAAGEHEGETRFFEIADTGLSTTEFQFASQHAEEFGYDVRESIVPLKPLASICREHSVSEIHFLKVDVEGGEAEVIKGFDFSYVRPWIILVEATLPNTQITSFEDWELLLFENQYHYIYFDGLNRFYIADEHSELDAAFKVPPNVWDGFETAKEFRLKELDSYSQQLESLLQDNELEREQLQHHIQTLEKYVQEISQQHQSLAEYTRRVEDAFKDSQGHQDEISSYCKHLEQSLEDNSKSFEALQDWTYKLESQTLQLEKDLQESQREKGVLAEQLQQVHIQNAQLEENLKEAQQEQQVLEAYAQQLKISLKDSERERHQLARQSQNLEASAYVLEQKRLLLESRCRQVELSWQESDENYRKLEAYARDLESHIRRFEQENKTLRVQLQQLEAAINALMQSTSIRITAPIRWIGNLLRQLRHSPRAVISKIWRSIDPKVRPCINWVLRFVWGRPWLKKILVSFFDRLPALRDDLRRIAFPTIITSPPLDAAGLDQPVQSSISAPLGEANLSDREVQILQDLKQVIMRNS